MALSLTLPISSGGRKRGRIPRISVPPTGWRFLALAEGIRRGMGGLSPRGIDSRGDVFVQGGKLVEFDLQDRKLPGGSRS